MTERAKEFMASVWESRNMGADTEEKLVAFILRLASSQIKTYTAQNDLVVLDRNDMIELANEVEQLNETV